MLLQGTGLLALRFRFDQGGPDSVTGMKSNVVALAAIVLAAGVVSAFGLTPSAHVASQMAAAEPKSPPAPVAIKETFKVRQPPVPLLFKPRPPVQMPAFETEPLPPEPVKTAEAMGGAAAKAAVEADGYKGVKLLGRGEDGLWHAQGLRGSTVVSLTVDLRGTVTTQ